jgi:hypothetical protein
MTGPALLIALIGQVIQSVNREGGFDLVAALVQFVMWWVAIGLLHGAAVLLRGKAKFTTTLRVAGFAQAAHLLELFGFLPVLGPVARMLGLLIAFVGVWIGTATAHELRGFRTLVLPVIYILVIVVSVFFITTILAGAALETSDLLTLFGWTPTP